MKRLMLLTAVLGLGFLCLVGGQAWGDDGFYVIAGGGPSGKVLKTQVFTSSTQDITLGNNDWTKLSAPQWIFTKVSPTSYLVITYQDMLGALGTGAPSASSMYQLRVNDQPSPAGPSAAMLACIPSNYYIYSSYGATAVWSGLPKGDAALSIWHRQNNCSQCTQNAGPYTTTVLVMEIQN